VLSRTDRHATVDNIGTASRRNQLFVANFFLILAIANEQERPKWIFAQRFAK
jgi:hypothetical protein